MKEECGCCEGIEKLTPLPTANRPGLNALGYRVGTHGTFLETMKARLSSLCLASQEECKQGLGYPLHKLNTRQADDPAIALLDAWATVADVLTFYQERIANEGYLRTATERRSILELARLVGYKLRPGVASSVYLAYTLDENSKDEVVIPNGARSQSVPGPAELPQAFETGEDLKARAKWNNLKPRITQPQTKKTIKEGLPTSAVKEPRVYLKGINTNLKPNDPLLINFGEDQGAEEQEVYRVSEVVPDPSADHTKVTVQPWLGNGLSVSSVSPVAATLSQVLAPLAKPPSLQPRNSTRLERSVDQAFARTKDTVTKDTVPQLLATLRPELAPLLYKAWANVPVTPLSTVKVYALRTRASVFGHNAPLEPIKNTDGVVVGSKEWDLKTSTGVTTEDFEIDTQIVRSDVIEIAAETEIATGVKIGGKQLTVKRPLKIETFDIDFPEAQDKITVSITEGAAGETMVKYAFHNRPVVITLIFDQKNGEFKASSKGSDPTTVITTNLDSASGLPRITVKGTRQIPSMSQTTEVPTVVFLDAPYAQIIPGSWIVLERPNAVPNIGQIVISRVVQASERSRADYGITAKGTRIELGKPWLDLDSDTFAVIRGTSVFAQSELLELAEEPIDPVEEPVCDDEIELEGLYDGLESGRWLIVSGERTDVVATTQQANDNTDNNASNVRIEGVPASELVMLAGVEQDFDINVPGDKTHSRLLLAEPLAYCYKRDTVTVYGNVVKATHGETRKEVLGSGDGAKALQAFTLKQPPLTFVSASNPSGVDSTLKVFVNDIQWHETDTLAGLSSSDRNFITKTDDESKTTVIFGNGKEGARPPTGIENIKSEYRNGIGKPGNVKAGQISLLVTRPLGVKEVINPLRASGGADKEGRDQARKNAPLAVKALDRLVSVQDYADFARTFAGIGKARAEELSDGRRQLVHVTIAGADDIPIDETSDLFQNLRRALLDFGDPFQPIQLAVRELMLLIISARVRILPDYQWEPVVTQLRVALLDAFSFERRELGQDVLLSAVISVMQGVRGVAYVDADAFGGVPEKMIEAGERRLLTPEEISDEIKKLVGKERPESRLTVNLAAREEGTIRPAQLAFLTPDVPATLILNQIT